jgi:hypothetical protein
MKDSEIVEVLEDGTIHHFDLDVCDEAADEALDNLFEKENKVLKFDFTASVFSLFASSIEILTTSGWTTEDLITAVIDYSQADDVDSFIDDEDDND